VADTTPRLTQDSTSQSLPVPPGHDGTCFRHCLARHPRLDRCPDCTYCTYCTVLYCHTAQYCTRLLVRPVQMPTCAHRGLVMCVCSPGRVVLARTRHDTAQHRRCMDAHAAHRQILHSAAPWCIEVPCSDTFHLWTAACHVTGPGLLVL
jgi:hypothetical protein